MRSPRPALRAAAAGALVALAACAHRGPAPGPEGAGAEGAPPGVEVGLASYYGERFQGRRTASGARYDARALTCAHPTAPFGTRLKVTELESGRSVEVTVTDRGPFGRGRVVDLSLAAARRLGIVEKGLARVRVERVGAAPEG